MRELSLAEQRYQAVLAVIKDGRTVTETAAAVGVSRQSLHAWLARYEAEGLEGLADRSHRPAGHPGSRLAEADYYWLGPTFPDGRPHAVPIWGLWSANQGQEAEAETKAGSPMPSSA